MGYLNMLNFDEIRYLACFQLCLVTEYQHENSFEFYRELLLFYFETNYVRYNLTREITIYPTEKIINKIDKIINNRNIGASCLGIPTLNTQFLSFHDYLLRNLKLFYLETAFSLKTDLRNVFNKNFKLSSWSRISTKIISFKITYVRYLYIGSDNPSEVLAEIVYSLNSLAQHYRITWDEIQKHEVLFLLTLKHYSKLKSNQVTEKNKIKHIRGCEVIELRDETNIILNEIDTRFKSDNKIISQGLKRTVLVSLDPVQYSIDIGKNNQDPNLYDAFQLLVRRDEKKNNFRAVIETILDMLTDNYSLPQWLHDLFLGYGDLSKNQSQTMLKQSSNLEFDMLDTFLDEKHSQEIISKKTK